MAQRPKRQNSASEIAAKTDGADIGIIQSDPYLRSYEPVIRRRLHKSAAAEQRLTQGTLPLAEFAAGHEYFGLHRTPSGWALREWAPNADHIELIGTCNGWKATPEYFFKKDVKSGNWELLLPPERLHHHDLYKLRVCWPGGEGERIPAYARRVVQDEHTKMFSAQVWAPDAAYRWKHPFRRSADEAPRIYEAHVGMAQEEGKVGSYQQFQQHVLPRVVAAGYNTLQLMAVQEHPYYGSFGYHVSSFFAASSRFGTPDELKDLVDAAHGAGLAVIMDIVHSHAVRNETEGISRQDGRLDQYFHPGDRGMHVAWDSRCFDYGKTEVLHFLLSNCRFWLDEYHFDGYRFDGVTSMLYFDHGLSQTFTHYDQYFGPNCEDDAYVYLALANSVIHSVRSDALTIAEDVSGMPGLAAPATSGGVGFDYRLSMGTPDYWIKLIKEVPDEQWHMSALFHELTNRRCEEKTISYVESHDQALVGDQTIIFRLIGAAMYDHMGVSQQDLIVDRGIALHKMIRLVTLATAGHGWLNFMGNEFGHPEWIDFPREGNGWSYHYARRQWHLADDPALRYHFLGSFGRAMMDLCRRKRFLATPGPRLLCEHVADQVLAFERAGLVFAFNFSPARSFSDYALSAPAGTYRVALDSDAVEFGGFGRVAAGLDYPTRREGPGVHKLLVYLPARSGVVFEKVD